MSIWRIGVAAGLGLPLLWRVRWSVLNRGRRRQTVGGDGRLCDVRVS